jgi:hypothetical protein
LHVINSNITQISNKSTEPEVNRMSENAQKHLEQIGACLTELPNDVAESTLNQYAARMEGFAEGFAAGTAHAQKRPA